MEKNVSSYKILYFAYGSNLNPVRMAERVPGAEFIGTGHIRGWKLAERLYADVEPCRGRTVHGAVYGLSREGLMRLDHFEGYPNVYMDKAVKVRMNGGGTVDALMYVMTDMARAGREGLPFPEPYRKICSDGADSRGIRNEFKSKVA